MTTGKDTASFFENGTTEQFEYCYKLYPQVLKLKAEKKGKKPLELIRLDQWYQNDLPKQIKARGKDAHIEYDELVQTMKWKQSRGKFYPQLSYLIKVNTPRAVMTETKKAFRKLPNLEQAITALSNLKGVGTTMASALLAAAAPDSAPFMADECLMAIPEIEGIDYTIKEYLNFVQHIEAKVARLNTQAGGEKPFWSPHRVELALWAHYVANDLSPELLDEMPGPGAGGNTNGKTKVLDENSQDNTNDGDDESMGLGNTNATESETDNENTNPGISAAVDGDSNFVSNDSTSQEPLIDENTTQTTTTTSTDDGEVGTPLASDSESNLEAPTTLNNQDIKQKQATQQEQKKSIVGSAVGGDESQSTVSNDAPPQLLKQLNSSSSNNNNNNNNSNNKSNSSTSSSSNSLKNGNGNGPLNVGSDSLDGDSNSCALGTDEVVSEIDETSDVDDGDDDLARMGADDSSSNSNQKPTTTTAAVTLSASLTEGNSSSDGAGALNLGQKRVHHSTYNVSSSDLVNSIGEQLARDQPELKKLRSE